MKKPRKPDEGTKLSRTQQVLYQKEFKRANKVYEQISQQGNRS